MRSDTLDSTSALGKQEIDPVTSLPTNGSGGVQSFQYVEDRNSPTDIVSANQIDTSNENNEGYYRRRLPSVLALFSHHHDRQSMTSKEQTEEEALEEVANHEQFKAFFEPPQLYRDWHNIHTKDPLKVSWVELFYDVIVVAAAIRLGSTASNHLSVSNVCIQLLSFAAIWLTWSAINVYITRFPSSDLLHSTFLLLHSAGALAMVLFIDDEGPHDSMQGFLIGFAFTRFVLIIQYLMVCFYLPRVRVNVGWIMASFILSVALAAGGEFVPGRYGWWFLFGALCIEQAQPALLHIFVPQEKRVPVDVEHLAERHGQLVMIMLGEDVLTLGLSSPPRDAASLATVFFLFLTVFNVQTLYFEAQPARANQHAMMRKNFWAGYLFYALHLLLDSSLLFIGVAIKEVIKHLKTDEHISESDAWMICVPLSAALLSVVLIRLSHKSFKGDQEKTKNSEPVSTVVGESRAHQRSIKMRLWIGRLILMVLVPCLPLLTKAGLKAVEWTSISAGITSVAVLIDTWGRSRRLHKAARRRAKQQQPIVVHSSALAANMGGTHPLHFTESPTNLGSDGSRAAIFSVPSPRKEGRNSSSNAPFRLVVKRKGRWAWEEDSDDSME